MGSILDYKPDSETIVRFHNSTAVIRAICGPPGSGKSVAWSNEIMYIAMRQEADDNKERLLKVGIVRKTFRRLSTTTRKTVMDWIPDGFGTITQTAPMHGDIEFGHPSGDGTTVKIHYDFMALDTPEDLENLDSYEASIFVWNEASEGDKDSMVKMVERIGRFPSPKDGVGCTEPCVLVDFNPQSKEHWLYKVFVKGEFKLPKVEGLEDILDSDRPVLEYFEQPPAVFCLNFEAADSKREEPRFRINMSADNIDNVKPAYYLNQLQVAMAVGAWDKVCTRLMMMWRTVAQGKLIHPQFDSRFHKSGDPLEAGDGDTVLVGIDTSGIHPAAFIAQSIRGRLQGYLVLYGKEMGLDEFFGKIMIPTIRAKFPNCDILAICDPANARDGRTATSPTTMLKDEYGIMAITPGKSNAFNLRKRAVAKVLNMMGAFIMDGTVQDTDFIKNQAFMEAIMSTYIHKPIKGVYDQEGNQVYENTPASKNDNSHGIDAFQYLCMHFVSVMAENEVFTGGRRKITKGRKPKMPKRV